jgi:hypothetical protein
LESLADFIDNKDNNDDKYDDNDDDGCLSYFFLKKKRICAQKKTKYLNLKRNLAKEEIIKKGKSLTIFYPT